MVATMWAEPIFPVFTQCLDGHSNPKSRGNRMYRQKLYSIILSGLVIILCLLFRHDRIGAQETKAEGVCFRWAFGAMVGPPDDQEFIAIDQDTRLKSGDKLKMLVSLEKKCFVYVVYQDANDKIFLLFPYRFEQYQKDYEVRKTYYIPQGDNWFELDQNTGFESFYLIAAHQRLSSLENLLNAYDSATSKAKPSHADQIIREIRKIRKRHKTFVSTAERPVEIGGTVRGFHENDFASIATEISAEQYYTRTFTIDHR
jgi:Domain of unknown function (DUF4384)